MKKAILFICLFVGCVQVTDAQFIIADVIKLVAKKVINAIDLAVQQAQNKTIVLQNAQKELENVMSALDLDEISGWVEKQKDLYQEYYSELSQVKQLIADYLKVKSIVRLQASIVSQYQSSFNRLRQDKNFSSSEIDYMQTVYSGIVDESLKNMEQALLVTGSLVAQMSDGERLTIINSASTAMQHDYDDLNRFSGQNIQLSLERGRENGNIETVKALYGLE